MVGHFAHCRVTLVAIARQMKMAMHRTLSTAPVSQDRLLQLNVWKLLLQAFGEALCLVLQSPSDFTLWRLEQVLLLLHTLRLDELLLVFYSVLGTMILEVLQEGLVLWPDGLD